MPAVLVTAPTATQNSPFLPQWRPKPSPVLIAPTHGGMTRLSGPKWPAKYREHPPRVATNRNTVVQAPKFKHITPILKSLHWLKVSELIEYKIISLTYEILNTTQSAKLYNLVSIQPPHDHNTRSSPYVTLIKPSSSLKVTHRSFRHASPHLWNQLELPTSLRIPRPNYSSPPQRPSFEHAGLTCYTLLSPSITFSLFHSELKTYLFRKSYPPP